jgi:hypothetical protein
VYESSAGEAFDFTKMLEATEKNRQDQSIHIDALRKGDDAAYFRSFLQERIKNPAGQFRVVILLSTPISFPRGANTSPIQFGQNCECALIYLQLAGMGFGDDLEKMLKPLQPKRLEAGSPLEMRKAIARIIQELERL